MRTPEVGETFLTVEEDVNGENVTVSKVIAEVSDVPLDDGLFRVYVLEDPNDAELVDEYEIRYDEDLEGWHEDGLDIGPEMPMDESDL